MRRSFVLVVLALCAAASLEGLSTDVQLNTVRDRIRNLEERLRKLADETEDVERERERLDAELELADARVQEVELLLDRSNREAERLREEVAGIAGELDNRREQLDQHLRVMAVLGRPGPLQLFYDAVNGGDLERAVGTVAVLTAGQIRLVEEYRILRRQHVSRLAELSQTLEIAQGEARRLEERRNELEEVRLAVSRRLRNLQNSRASADARLEDLREREAALERLVGVLSSRQRFTGNEDIRGYRGALPWPVEGRVVQSFGRHYLPKYATYTVCNGLRFDVASTAPVNAVFPGVVAYARHFKGYGNMVVLDHGRGIYSLVAGLATIHVRLDQRVTMGMRLGLASPPTEGGNIYFEFRVGEKPEDPKRWLQLKGGPS